MFELVHCRLYQCNLKLLELNDDEELYKYIKNKTKSYESIINKLGLEIIKLITFPVFIIIYAILHIKKNKKWVENFK